MSPTTLSEDDRRELIARQHRALYGTESSLYSPDEAAPRHSQDVRVAGLASARGASPLAFDPFVAQGNAPAEAAAQMTPQEQSLPERRTSTSPPSANPAHSSQKQGSGASASSAGGSPPLVQGRKASTAAGVAPIGTRPVQPQVASAKHSTNPVTPAMNYGFTPIEQTVSGERSASAASNPALAEKTAGLAGWGSNSGVWGPSKMQASVWG